MSKNKDKAKSSKASTKLNPEVNRVDPKLLEILVCPATKQPLEYDHNKQELVSVAAKLAFPIRDGIPIMLIEEARVLDTK